MQKQLENKYHYDDDSLERSKTSKLDCFHDDDERDVESCQTNSSSQQDLPIRMGKVHLPVTGKKRNLDSFMEELKKEQEARQMEKEKRQQRRKTWNPEEDHGDRRGSRSHEEYDRFGRIIRKTELRNSNQELQVFIPQDHVLRTKIQRFIELVLNHGPIVEAWFMYKFNKNPDFKFLNDISSPEYVYYKWRLKSLVNGDDIYVWSSKPVEIEGLGILTPPDPRFYDIHEYAEDVSLSFSCISESEEEQYTDQEYSSRKKPNASSKKKRYMSTTKFLKPKYTHHFMSCLRNLTLDREDIGHLMAFCLDHADAAEQIVHTLIDSLVNPHTPVFPNKIARLYLISDLLYNSSIPLHNVWKYRLLFEANLDRVWKHFGDLCLQAQQCVGRLRSDYLKRVLMYVLDLWSEWMIYTDDVIQRFRDVFHLIVPPKHENTGEHENKEKRALKSKNESNLTRQDGTNQISTTSVKNGDSLQETLPNNVEEQDQPLTNVKSGFVPIDSSPKRAQPETGLADVSLTAQNEDDDQDDVDGIPLTLPAKKTMFKFNLEKTSISGVKNKSVSTTKSSNRSSVVCSPHVQSKSSFVGIQDQHCLLTDDSKFIPLQSNEDSMNQFIVEDSLKNQMDIHIKETNLQKKHDPPINDDHDEEEDDDVDGVPLDPKLYEEAMERRRLRLQTSF